MDENQMMNGKGVLETNGVKYSGDFQINQFNGAGTIEYQDTGNVFKGQFAFHQKSGPATFTLKNGRSYTGTYNANFAQSDKADYGPRF